MDLSTVFPKFEVTLGTRTYNVSAGLIRVFALLYGGWALRAVSPPELQALLDTGATYLGLPAGAAATVWTIIAWLKTPTTATEAVKAELTKPAATVTKIDE